MQNYVFSGKTYKGEPFSFHFVATSEEEARRNFRQMASAISEYSEDIGTIRSAIADCVYFLETCDEHADECGAMDAASDELEQYQQEEREIINQLVSRYGVNEKVGDELTILDFPSETVLDDNVTLMRFIETVQI
jgi:hypothetical protein